MQMNFTIFEKNFMLQKSGALPRAFKLFKLRAIVDE
jgi:hypothetical protein